MSNKTTKQNLLCCSAQQQSSITGRDNHAPDAQTDAILLPLVNTLNAAKTSVDKNEPSNSSATNYNNMKNIMHGNGVEESPFQSRISSSSSKEKKMPPLLVLSNNSPEIERDNSHSVNENYININRVHGEVLASDVDHKESPISFSNIGEQQRYVTDSTRAENSLLDGVKSMFGDLNRQFKEGFSSLDNQLEGVRKEFGSKLDQIDKQVQCVRKEFDTKLDQIDGKFNKRFDQLAQKMDDIYERGAVSTIMNRLQVDHVLNIPYLPSNRTFSAHYSKQSNIVFDNFGKYLHKTYSHIWTKQYKPVLVSLQPQEIQIDVLGFAFEAATTERPFINSPNIMPIHSTSSHTTIKEFMANTIICGEVTTSNLTFDNDELVKLEKNKFNLNNDKAQATHRLLHKMLQLERSIAFILQYYQNVELNHILAVVCGRFNDCHGNRSPDVIYKSIFESRFSTKIPLLNELYELEKHHMTKKLYFI
ncbi:unnamed protein product [Rotaria magnacalcarata]|uniref:Uncharacterized protein n=1 Tax=Rotaria magnacalcarata TaxID=392030 RepID=A0A816YV07_9BILA|nr:unnamed protein product [Rotaria magnacalcarata]CAF2171244.1 unnamed protein product [Rotaria magnacalcarata]